LQKFIKKNPCLFLNKKLIDLRRCVQGSATCLQKQAAGQDSLFLSFKSRQVSLDRFFSRLLFRHEDIKRFKKYETGSVTGFSAGQVFHAPYKNLSGILLLVS
jgi:hypothetical protein